VNDTTTAATSAATAVSGSDNVSSGGRWEDVHMIYDVAWPLHLVLTRQAMLQYGKLSALLLHVRRCCTEVRLATLFVHYAHALVYMQDCHTL
jgi:Gamma tubulin complex component C-terminal